MNRHLLATAILALGTTCAQAQAPAPLKIVSSIDLSGAAADVGKDVLVGVQYAIEILNRNGGVLGRQVVLEYQDNGTNPQRAVSQAGALVQGGAQLLLLPASSAGALAVSKTVAAKARIPACVSVSGSDDLTMKDFQPYVYSVTPNGYMETRATAAFLAKQPYKRYAVMSADYAGGRSVVERFKEFIKEFNPQAEIVAEEYPKFGSIDYTASINKLLAAKPDFIYTSMFGADLITFSKQAASVGFFKQVNNRFSALYDEGTLKALGEYAAFGTEGAQRAPASYFLKSNAQAQAYVNQFRAKHGTLPPDWSTLGHDCVTAWAAAVTAAKSADADVVMKAIREGSFQSPRGPITFGKLDHQADVPVFYGKVERSNELTQAVIDVQFVTPGKSVRATDAVLRKSRGE